VIPIDVVVSPSQGAVVTGTDRESSIRLLIVVDVRLYREGLAAILPPAGVAVVGAAGSRAEANATVHGLEPDVVIVDVAMPGAFDLIRELRADVPTAQLIAFGVDDDIAAIIECAEAGAAAYVSANAGVDDLVRTIREAAGGELRCSPRIAAELFRRIGDRSSAGSVTASDPAMLTTRERQVLAVLRQGLSNKEIAARMNISEATVKNHVHRLLEKLQVTSRIKAAACVPRPKRARSRLTPDHAFTGT
jgi:DNA-binding NarL/FixJ family response regulator